MKKITKDMTIADIIESNPAKARQLAEVMFSYNLQCFGCGAAAFETLEEGARVHGMDDKTLDKFVKALNGALKEDVEVVDVKGCNVKLTVVALKRIKEIMKEDKKEDFGLRISILPGGCMGHVYDMKFQEKKCKDDLVIEQDGLKIFVDVGSVEQLNGIEVDYVVGLNESGFKFNNPNISDKCGCGKSFN